MPAKKIYRNGAVVGRTNSQRRYILCSYREDGTLSIVKRSDNLDTIRKVAADRRRYTNPTSSSVFGYDLVTEMELVNV